MRAVARHALWGAAATLVFLAVAVGAMFAARHHAPSARARAAPFMLRVPSEGGGGPACVGALECRDGICNLGLLPCNGDDRVTFTQAGNVVHDLALAATGYRVVAERKGPVQAAAAAQPPSAWAASTTGIRLLPVTQDGEVAVWSTVGLQAPKVRRGEDTRGAGGVGGAWLVWNPATRALEWSPAASRARAPAAATLRRVALA